MATLDLNLAGTSYRFGGWGVADALYEKGRPLANYAGDLGSSAWADYLAALDLFTWGRLHVVGGQFYRESASGRNYPAKKQAARLREYFQTCEPRLIVCPFSAPSSCMAEADQTTLRANGTELTTGQSISTKQVFVHGTDANWQTWLDAIDHGVTALRNMGARLDIFETPNEYGGTNGHANYWLSYLADSRAAPWVNNIWRGDGRTGGGIKARHPYLSLLNGYPVNGGGPAAIDADGTAGPEVSYWGHGWYGTGLDAGGAGALGLGANTTRFGRGILSEFGPAAGSLTADNIRGFLRIAHQATAYTRVHTAVMWTSLRDITAKAVQDGRGVGYSATPLFNLNTAAGTYTPTANWWAMRPYLTAAGRGDVTAYCAAAQTALDTDTNFTPATGTYLSAFARDDGTYGLVYVNFSGSTRSDDISITTDGATPATLTGTRRDYSPMAGSGQEGSPGAASTTAGVISLTSVPTSTVVLLELS